MSERTVERTHERNERVIERTNNRNQKGTESEELRYLKCYYCVSFYSLVADHDLNPITT